MTNSAARVEVLESDIEDASKKVLELKAQEQQLIKAGQWHDAAKLSKERAIILKANHIDRINKGQDWLLRDTIRGATFTDPNSQLGSLAGDLILMRNLGYLKYILSWLPYVTTDLSAEPARFGQSILTRYIVPPDVLTWVPGVGFTSHAQQIADAGVDTTQAGGVTLRTGGTGSAALDADNVYGIPKKSVPNTTDVSVTLNMFKGVEIELPVSLLAGTVRNLFAEQLSAQTYSLAEAINKHVLGTIFSATWSGTITAYYQTLEQWALKDAIGVKNYMTISKIPNVGRFCLLHSFFYDTMLASATLLEAKAFMTLIHKDEREFATSELPPLFGIKFLESQLAAANDSGVLQTWTDPTSPGDTTIFGFAGTASSAIFVARPPMDFTSAVTTLGIPPTYSAQLMTEPDSGLTVMVFSYVDNTKMSISQRVCLMWGAAQGHPQIGILLKLGSAS